MEDKKKRYSPEQKMLILREYLENDVAISTLSERYGVNPNLIYNWKKELFEQGVSIFSGHKGKHEGQEKEKILRLETKLRDKDALISEIIEDNIRLKKKMSGEI